MTTLWTGVARRRRPLPRVDAVRRVHVIGISQYSTTLTETVAFAKRNRLSFPNLYEANGELAAAYGVRELPGYVFLDRQEGLLPSIAPMNGTDA